jgi:hypothetical protein
MEVRYAPYYCESKPRPARIGRPRGVNAMETLKHALAFVRGNAYTMILDGYAHFTRLCHERNRDIH